MSPYNETPKDKVYARCFELGLDEVKKQVEAFNETKNAGNLDISFRGNMGYVKAWIAEQEEKIQQEKRMKETASSAKWSAVAAAISAFVALVALFMDKILPLLPLP